MTKTNIPKPSAPSAPKPSPQSPNVPTHENGRGIEYKGTGPRSPKK